MISNNLLKCSALLYQRNGLDEDRNPSYKEPIILTRVWLTSSLAEVNGSDGKTSSNKMELTYDVYNSRPQNIKFSLGDKVEFDDTSYLVNSITPVYKDGLSHYLIGLS